MIRRPPRSTRHDTRCPDATLFRSAAAGAGWPDLNASVAASNISMLRLVISAKGELANAPSTADVADGEAAVGSDSRRERVRGGLGRRDAERGLRIDCFLCPGGGGRDGRGEGKDKQAAGGGTRHQIGTRWESWPRRWAVGDGLDSYGTKLVRTVLWNARRR